MLLTMVFFGGWRVWMGGWVGGFMAQGGSVGFD